MRPVFAKAHGCVKAEFSVNSELPAKYRVGVFAGEKYPAWIRFSNDGGPMPDAAPSNRGLALKLVGVPGKKLLPGSEDAVTQDFLMQNHPVFFNDTASDFLDFLAASFSGSKEMQGAYDQAHPETNRILADMDRNVLLDPLEGQYWTPTPYRLGAFAMKYKVRPSASKSCGRALTTKTNQGPNFLRENLVKHLAQGETCLDFMVQVDESGTQPLDRATVAWDESKAPFVKFAEIRVPGGQDINAVQREAACENLSFNGWHAVAEHEPLGSLNLARKIVYQQMAEIRRQHNAVPRKEPTSIKDEE